MAITFLNQLSAAAVDDPIDLVVYSTEDTSITWSADVAGVTFDPPTTTIGAPDFSTTMLIPASAAGNTVTVTAKGDVNTAGAQLPIEAIQFYTDPNDPTHDPSLTISASADVVTPGAGLDAEHAVELRAVVKLWDDTASAFVGQEGLEVQWSFSPDLNDVVVNSLTLPPRRMKKVSDGAGGQWYSTITKSDGSASIFVNLTAQIGRLTALAEVSGAGRRTEIIFFSTQQESDPIYQNTPTQRSGPFTDPTVNLDGTTSFNVMFPSLVPPLGTHWKDYQGWLEIDHTYDPSYRKVPVSWDSMADVMGNTIQITDAVLDQQEKPDTNILGLFIQKTTGGSVYKYEPFKFNTTGGYENRPIDGVSRHNWLPQIWDNSLDSNVQLGTIINRNFVRRNAGIPARYTGTFPQAYVDEDYYIFFEWFLNSVGDKKTDKQVSPQTVQLSALKIKAGEQTYTDTLATKYAYGFEGPGSLYLDFYLAKTADAPDGARIYSDWIRMGWVLATL